MGFTNVQFQLTAVRSHGADGSCLLVDFPFVIGRDAACDWVVVAPGIFSRHAELTLSDTGLVELSPLGEAEVFVEEKPVLRQRLKNGQRFRCGSVEFQFGLVSSRLRRLAGKEVFFWISAAILTAIQFWLAWRM